MSCILGNLVGFSSIIVGFEGCFVKPTQSRSACVFVKPSSYEYPVSSRAWQIRANHCLRDNGLIFKKVSVDKEALTQVDHRDVPISSQLAHMLHHRICRDRILKWWKYKGWFNDVYSLDIDWTVLAKSMKESSLRTQRFISKWVSHHTAVGRMMDLRKARVGMSVCLLCAKKDESRLSASGLWTLAAALKNG